ncbi:hypothetical protein I5Q34_32205 [Streptomyces sp. AV19]|uniref:hypothetical protein n=1 Tax=Streptomyces sp. AV19 TaxID=2793068 RepID=UPI0018FE3E2A|nr:hypothetical protein [Streptomyces sp. AV19]MBH1938870.1 hypothetical protein [Streptomyces sp. AV19]MDG4533511.1 hypothetical protein [Streptomyces sp. AV19]
MSRSRHAKLLAATGGALVLPFLVSSPAVAAPSPIVVYDAKAPQNTAKVGELMKSFCDPQRAAGVNIGGDGALLVAPSPWQIDQKVFPATEGLCEVKVVGSKKADPDVVKDQWRRLFQFTNRGSTESTAVSNESVMNSRKLGFTIGLSGDRSWFENPVKTALSASFNYEEVSQTTKTKEVRHPVAPRTRATVYQVPDVTEYTLQVKITTKLRKGVEPTADNTDVGADGRFRFRIDNLTVRDVNFNANSPVYEAVEEKLS